MFLDYLANLILPISCHGLSIVFTGELGSFDREKAECLVKACGGVVRGSVSGKTNLLVVGTTLEDGREVESTMKYKKAKEIIDGDNNKSKLRIIDKAELFSLIREGGGKMSGSSNSRLVTGNQSAKAASKDNNGDKKKKKAPPSTSERNNTANSKQSKVGSGSTSKKCSNRSREVKETASTTPQLVGPPLVQKKDNLHKSSVAMGSEEALQRVNSIAAGSKKEQKMKTKAAKKRCRFDSSSSSDEGLEEMKRQLREKNKKRCLPNPPPPPSSDEDV